MHSSNALCYKWHKRGAPQVFKGLIAEKLQISQPAKDTKSEYQRWSDDSWHKLSASDCAASASILRGKAGGMDADVASIPLEHWDVYSDFAQWIDAAGLSPSS